MPIPQQSGHDFELPNGAVIRLDEIDEVEHLQQSADLLTADYTFDKYNDRVMLGALLLQQLTLYRAQKTLAKTVGKGPGQVGVQEAQAARKSLLESAEEIRALEKALGIDKKTREAGGQHTVQTYITTLKRAAHEYGVHIAERTKAYEDFAMELRVKLRMLDNADVEDRGHHGISEQSILDYCRGKLSELEEVDKTFANQKGKLWAGKL